MGCQNSIVALLILALSASWTTAQFKNAKCAADFLFVVDGSSSVRAEFRPQMKMVEQIVQQLTIRPDAHRVALIQFSSKEKARREIEFDTTANQNQIEGTIRHMPYMTGITETAHALRMAKEVLEGRRKGLNCFVIVITDGRARRDPEEAAKELHSMPKVHTYAVGLGELVDKDELRIIATDESSVFLGEDSAQDLVDKFSGYLDCPAITTTTTTTTPRPTTRKPRTTIPTPPPVRAPPKKAPECLFDLLYIIDASGSEARSYGHEIEHAVEFAELLQISPRNARIAQIRFSSRTKQRVDFTFNTFKSTKQVVAKIKKSPFLSGSTRIDLALQKAIDVLEDPKSGLRGGNVPLYVIMFSDGYTRKAPLVAPIAAKLRAMAKRLVVVAVTRGTPNYELMDIIAGGPGLSYAVNRKPTHLDFADEWKQITAKCRPNK